MLGIEPETVVKTEQFLTGPCNNPRPRATGRYCEVEMKKVLERYVYNFSNIDTYFISLKQLNKIECIIDGRTVYINGKESFIPGVLHKTIEALKLLVKILILLLPFFI
jgi:hypothetical protein